MQKLSLLAVFAHPDDEQGTSGTMAMAAAEGIKTGLICATRGELGEISEPHLATPETLGPVREAEMRAAATVLGIKYLWFLDYRDSGWIGIPANFEPEAFLQVDRQEALGKLVKLIREFKPTVITTFDRTGGYGHPDHITIYELTTQAFSVAADPNQYKEMGEPWQAKRLFYTAFPRSRMAKVWELMEKMQINSPFTDLDRSKLGLDDAEITNEVNVSQWYEVKRRSLQMHRTQINPNSPLEKLSEKMKRDFGSKEFFSLGAGEPLPDTPEAKGDIFAGLRG